MRKTVLKAYLLVFLWCGFISVENTLLSALTNVQSDMLSQNDYSLLSDKDYLELEKMLQEQQLSK